jgi:tetratricopeptide (TPR) repeat protein
MEAAGDRAYETSGILHAKGSILRRQGRWEEALEIYKRVFELDPRTAPRDLASTYMWMRQYPSAQHYFDRGIELEPTSGFLRYRKAAISWLWKADTRAAREVLELIPEGIDDEGTIRWAWFWQEIYEGNFKAALESLKNAPGDWIRADYHTWPKALMAAHAYQYLGEGSTALASYESACRLLESEVERTPQEAKFQRALSIAYAGLGRNDEALAAAQKAVEIWPIDQHPYFGVTDLQNLALVYTMVGELELAIDTLDRVLSMPDLISIPLLELDPRWTPLRADPRFAELKKKYGGVSDVL